jgi:hypothetical protein
MRSNRNNYPRKQSGIEMPMRNHLWGSGAMSSRRAMGQAAATGGISIKGRGVYPNRIRPIDPLGRSAKPSSMKEQSSVSEQPRRTGKMVLNYIGRTSVNVTPDYHEHAPMRQTETVTPGQTGADTQVDRGDQVDLPDVTLMTNPPDQP